MMKFKIPSNINKFSYWFLPALVWILLILFFLEIFFALMPVIILGAVTYIVIRFMVKRKMKQAEEAFKAYSKEQTCRSDKNEEKIIDVEVIKD